MLDRAYVSHACLSRSFNITLACFAVVFFLILSQSIWTCHTSPTGQFARSMLAFSLFFSSFSSASIWNGLPPSHHTAESVHAFQSRFKIYLFQKHLLWPVHPVVLFSPYFCLCVPSYSCIVNQYMFVYVCCACLYLIVMSTSHGWPLSPLLLVSCEAHQACLLVGKCAIQILLLLVQTACILHFQRFLDEFLQLFFSITHERLFDSFCWLHILFFWWICKQNFCHCFCWCYSPCSKVNF